MGSGGVPPAFNNIQHSGPISGSNITDLFLRIHFLKSFPYLIPTSQ